MNAWEWVTAVLAIWGAVSIMAGVFWGLIGRRIFRPRPIQPRIVRKDGEAMSQNELNAVRSIMSLDAELRGLRGER
jgi:hypothetical protein